MPKESERSSQERARDDLSGSADTSSGRWRAGWTALLITMLARAVLATIAMLLLISLAPALFGWHPTVVSSGSMEPRLLIGDVVVSRPLGSVPLALHQVILENDPNHAGWLRLHRFIGITGTGQVVTKGDANPQRDTASVPMSAVIGIASLRVPYIGLPAVWLGSGQYPDLASTSAALVLLIWCSVVFQQDVAPKGSDPSASRPERVRRAVRRAHRARPTGLTPSNTTSRVAVASVIGIVLSLLPAGPVGAASFTAPTSNTSNALAAANRFSCSERVLADSPANYYKLAEASGTTAADSSGNNHPGTYSSTGVTYGATGPCAIDGSTAVTLDGGTTTGVTTTNGASAPTTFSVEIWFKTTSSAGGLLIGMFTDPTSATANQDRVLYMTTTGKIAFGMYDNSPSSPISATSATAYNDGAWHLADVTYTVAAGMTVYVDGTSVATNTTSIPPNIYTGYWRIGYGTISYWPGAPTTGTGFTGILASAAVYSQALTGTQIGAHYSSTRGTCASAVLADSPSNYYKFNETGGATAADTSGNHRRATYGTGITYGVSGPCATDGATGVALTGGSEIWTANALSSPNPYSAEVWFNTTTTAGGLILGMYTDPTAGSGDRLIYMQNSGAIDFGMYNVNNNSVNVISSPSTYNNGAWHLADVTFSPSAGMALYIDGVAIGSLPNQSIAFGFTGYWRIGYGYLGGWSNVPTNQGFTGSIANAAIFPVALTSTMVAAHYSPR